jgi:hypothetical protein
VSEHAPESTRFWAEHAAGGPGNVVAAYARRNDGGETLGIFSTIALAEAWAESLDEEEYAGVVFAPYVIDVPEYGNVPKEERQ